MIPGVPGLLLGSSLALAHPVGRHVVQHDLELNVGTDTLQVDYTTVVPPEIVRDRPGPAVTRELAAGLLITIDGRTVSWTPSTGESESDPHGSRIHIEGTVPLPQGSPIEVSVSNGNLPETRSVFRTTTTVAPMLRVDDSSLFVMHEGALARSDEGRLRSDASARRTTLTIDRPTGLATLHRALQSGPLAQPRPAEAARWTSPWTTNQSRPWMLTAVLLGVCGVRLPRTDHDPIPRGAVPVGLVAITLADLAGPTALSAPLVAVGGVAALACVRLPALAWLVLPALVASLDLWGLGTLVVLLQAVAFRLGGSPTSAPRTPWAIVALGVVLGLAQLGRLLGTAA